MSWPVLHSPPRRWVRGWRVGVAVVVAAGLVIVGRHVLLGGLSAWGWVLVVAGALYVARAAVLVWRRAARPRLSRADARTLNPAEGAREREELDKKMRLAVRERTPLPPELHRTAALAVAHSSRTQPWYPAVVGLFGLLVIAVAGPGSAVTDPFNLVVYAFTAACYLPLFTDEHRIRRAAEAAGAVPSGMP
ncbi:hypothetical protein [Pseudonocardia sp. 73-21]|uniref:hypothetical protein n=1 Tax=Pseudonocardia sp. 73-21 TaxID=1895809 RepID=UPI002614C826|nr:hypothetical protein [Pseudonocardia sp. 73-21]